MPVMRLEGGPLSGSEVDIPVDRPLWNVVGRVAAGDPNGEPRIAWAINAEAVSIPIEKVRVQARPGVLVLEIPAGWSIADAKAKGQLRVYLDSEQPPPSVRGRITRYVCGDDGQWHFLPVG